MPTDIIMPQLGESIAEGTVVKWLVPVGGTIEKDQSLLEVETEKVALEIPSPATGVLSEIVVKEGETVPVGALLARIDSAPPSEVINRVGGLPVLNFSKGRMVEASEGPFKLGGDFIREQNSSRGGEISHACMPGCMIECSNVYVDESGKEMVSPLEYETLGLMGSNCGLDHPDQVARVNAVANDLGIDTIEAGATLAVLMEAGLGKFGDEAFMLAALEDIRQGNERGRIFAQGAARAGAHYKVARIPVIKKQSISAYDPRVIEVTGISMMITAGRVSFTASMALFNS